MTISDALAHAVDRAADALAARPDVDAFEVRADHARDLKLARVDGRPATSVQTERTRVGIQVFAGGGSAWVHGADGLEVDLVDLVDRAVRLARASGRRGWRIFPPRFGPTRRLVRRAEVKVHPFDAPADAVPGLLARVEAGAASVDPSARVQAAFGARAATVVYADSGGTRVSNETLLSTLHASVVCRADGRVGDGTARSSGERGVGDHEDAGGAEALGAEAARRAREAVVATSFPAGRYRVLCDNHLAGMLAHESFGHLTEYDLVASSWSALRGRRGDRLASELVSISDAPVVEGSPRDGVHVPVDDQGTPGRKVTMLDRGVLREWLHTRDSSGVEDDAPTGNGRALDARFPSIVRMRNTYFEPGDASLDEALKELGDGVYLIGSRGGAPASDGSFMFTATRGYLVRGGRIAEPVRPVSIHGNVLDFLRNVSLVTSDFRVVSNYFGGCGKWDQSFLPVGVGGPHVLVEGALTGGLGS